MSTGRSDVLFVFPPAPGNAGAFKNHLGVAYLRAALARDGLATAQYLNGNPGTIDSVAADILQRKYPIVGFTVYDSNARLCIALAQSIKRQKPETQIVFGGPTPTFNARPLMERHPVIDACVMGEAEETAAHIFAKLLGGGGLDEDQPGIAFRKNRQVVCTVLPALVGATQPGVQGALDASPSPYLSGILADGQEGVLTGRGCTHHCQYCCFAALGRMSLRLHSIERVVAELEYIAARQKCTGKHYPVAILDDAFTLLPPRAKALCRAIADRKLNLVLSCVTRADTVDEELIKLMQEAG
ncbi:MAG: cobalamin-dependent protein, partial [Candidatus Acidiferrum sp.]